MNESEVQITEVLALSFLLTQGQNMPSLQAVGLSEEMFSPGGRMLYRCIQEATPQNWRNKGFMPLNAITEYEDRRDVFVE